MRIGKPLNKNHLHIRQSDRVLEIGPGNDPDYRAHVLADKFILDNTHRSADIFIYPHQTLIHADAEHLPFADKEFDYVICKQVLEHAEDPTRFINELMRVGRAGYIETPSLIGEFLFPKVSHRWVVLDIDDKIVLYDKNRMPHRFDSDFGELFLNYLPYQSFPYKTLWLTEGDLMSVRYEWRDGIDFVVNPETEEYAAYFLKPWNREQVRKMFPSRSPLSEIRRTAVASWRLLHEKCVAALHRRMHRHLTLNEYLQMRNLREIPKK